MVLFLSHQSPSPPFPFLPSAPVLCLLPLHGADQPVPAWAALRFSSLGFWRVSPALPAPGSGAFSACSSQRTADGRGGREGRLRGWIREWIWCLLATPGQLSPPGFSRPPPTVLSRCGAELPRPDLAPSFPCTLAVAISLPLVCLADQIWSCAPPSSTPFPLGCHLRQPAPSSAAPFVAVAVAGSAGDIQGPPALSPSTKARSGCWLRAWLSRGLIITSPRTLNLTKTLSPWLERKGRDFWPGGDLGITQTCLCRPSRDRCLLHSLSTPFTSFSSSRLSSLPHLPLVRPLPTVSSLLWLWQVDCRSWEDQLSLFGTGLDGISFPTSPPTGQLLPTVLADWPKGDRA